MADNIDRLKAYLTQNNFSWRHICNTLGEYTPRMPHTPAFLRSAQQCSGAFEGVVGEGDITLFPECNGCPALNRSIKPRIPQTDPNPLRPQNVASV